MADSDHRSRRDLLKASITLAPVIALDSVNAQETPRREDLKQSAPSPDRPASVDYRPSFFTPAEWAFLLAACDRLIPKDDVGPGAIELGVPEYIDRQMLTSYGDGGIWYMQGPFLEAAAEFGYQSKLTPKEQYRHGIRVIDEYCSQTLSKTFAQLESAQQDDVLKKVEAGQINSEDLPLRTFFASFLLKNTLEGYFGDPMYGGNKEMGSWKMIGYPGVRADYVDWVDQYDRRYPYGPVSIYGRRG
jgi:gluconate 2-dehydrogenase gamma chain